MCLRTAELRTGGPLTYDQLDGHRLIVGQPGTGMRQVADEVMAANRSTIAVIESEHREAMLPMVLAGTGIAIMAQSWRGLARHAGLKVYELATETQLEVYMVHREVELTPAAEAFLGFTVPSRAW